MVNFNFYDRVTNTQPTGQISISQLAQLIASDPQVKQATQYIQATHAAGIADNFQSIPKAGYQKDKAERLHAILAAGTGAGRNVEAHNGLIPFDIDEGDPAALANFEAVVKQGKIPFVILAAKSAGGVGFWFLARVEIPAAEDCPKWLYDRATKGGRDYLQGVHELCHTAISQLIANDGGGALAGHNGKSLKNVRYIAHDPGLYVNENCQTFTVERLKLALQAIDEQDKDVATFAAAAAGIQADNWQAFCDQYARAKGYKPQPGQMHNYLNSYAIAANLLGISRAEVEQYAGGQGWRIATNCVSLPYSNYATNYGRWANRIEAAPAAKYELKQDQKLSEILTFDDIRGSQLIAPTGAGKSWLICNQPSRKIVIVVPLQSIAVDFAAKNGALLYMQGSTQQPANQLQAAKLIVTTYASFGKLSGYLGEAAGQFDLVFDEVHSFASYAGIQGRALNKSIQRAKEPAPGIAWQSVTIMTATPVQFIDPFLSKFEIVKVTREAGSAGRLTIIEAADTTEAAATKAEESIKAGRRPFILIDSKRGKAHKLKAILEGRGRRVALIHADNKGESTEYNDLTKNGIWPADIDCIICTTVLSAGVSVYTDRPVDIIVLGKFNSVDIAQFAARIRKQIPQIYVLKKEGKDRGGAGNFSAVDFYDRATSEAARALNSLLSQLQGQCISQQHTHENRALKHLNGLPVTNDGGQYSIDFVAMQGAYYSALTEAENKSDRLFTQNLERLGIEFLPVVQLGSDITSIERTEAKLVVAAQKAAEEAEYITTINDLQAEAQQHGNSAVEQKLQFWAARRKGAKAPTTAQLLAADRWERLNGYTGNTGLTLLWLADIGYKNADFLRAVARAAQYTAKQQAKQATNYSTAAAQLAKFTGGQYTIEQLFDCWLQAAAGAPELNFTYKELSQKAAAHQLLKRLRQFFEVSSTRARTEGGGWHEIYTLQPLAIDCYFAAPAHHLQDPGQQQQPKIDLHTILAAVEAARAAAAGAPPAEPAPPAG